MITIDASILVDALLEEIESAKERQRKSKALLAFLLSQNFELNAPKIVLVEVTSAIRRLTGRKDVDDALNFIKSNISLYDEKDIIENAIEVAKEGCRAADAYYISTAMKTGSMLVSADRRMVDIAKSIGVKAILIK
ncbi:hypothetical protein DRP05_00785 [Archaeoglobales archaeon]|nr:MAG: hypothetical protein DRP05_00785 [Archaeoglobales archaeon]